tara:strand:+ start:101 stop:448 length:348 start_codon:yes stop_codon:yes gene_type:complete
MDYCSDFKYDLKIGQAKEQELSKIFHEKRIEVKLDRKAHDTGNIFIEYESRNKPSGITTTQAEYYCIVINDIYHIIETSKLKDKCRRYLNTNRDVVGGDNNTSKGILLPSTELLQ